MCSSNLPAVVAQLCVLVFPAGTVDHLVTIRGHLSRRPVHGRDAVRGEPSRAPELVRLAAGDRIAVVAVQVRAVGARDRLHTIGAHVT